MSDYAFYWQRYLDEFGDDGEPGTGWLTSREWLVKRLHHGDRIWLFIGGDACGDEDGPHRAYLAQLLVVDAWGNNEEFQPSVQGSPRYRIRGIEERCILITPPLLVDDIFRRPGADPRQHIGIARQTPFELNGDQVAELLSLLRERCPKVHAVATRL